MKNFRYAIVLLLLMIAGWAFAGQQSTSENKQCSANKTEATFSPSSNAYKKISPDLIKYLPNLSPSNAPNSSAKAVPVSK